jgi:hypothetical protein
MKQFKDEQGRDWMIDVTVGAIKSVRELLKVDLWNFFGDEAKRILSDPPMLVDVVYVLCKQQCTERGLTDVDFGRLFRSDVLEAASNALIGAVIDFFPKSRQTILKAWAAKSETLGQQIDQKMMDQIQSLKLTDMLAPGKSQARSKSTRGR